MAEYNLTINNKKIFDFFKNNPNIDFEAMTLLMIDFIEKFNTDSQKTLSDAVNKEVLNSIKHLETKCYDVNKEYIENIRMIVKLNSKEETDKITQLLTKNTEQFVDKLKITLPNSENKIQESLTSINKTIISELKEHITNNSFNNMFLQTFDKKLEALQQPIITLITNHQEQITKKLTLEEIDKSKQESLFNELGDFLNKWKNSPAHKGNYGQNMLESVLNNSYPSAEVLNTSGTKASGDFMLKRDGKYSILIENKDYKNNVNIDEIKKFLRDINEQQTHGIFLSQSSGIISKPNYYIDIYEGKILVYLHNVEYNPDIIKSAVNIIDNLAPRIDAVVCKGITISSDMINNINSDYQIFNSKKIQIINTAKNIQKQLLVQIDELVFPTIAEWLDNKGISNTQSSYKCEICNAVFPTQRALASHGKKHKNININSNENTITVDT